MENLAVAARGLAEAARRDAGGAVEGAHEVGEVAEAGVEGDVTLRAGDGLSQPAGVPHNVIARSDDLEVIEINEPAKYGTWNLPEPPPPWR